MSLHTNEALRKLMIYQVYVRNYSQEGTFKAVEADLDRIQALGTDVVYLLPIHPIGEKNRKGSLGSPYSIRDYGAINPELGSVQDFQDLIDAVHQKGMKIMMDVVYNHTSYDSVLLENNPEFFYQNAQGEYTNRVADWWDITDFDYTKDRHLYDVLIDYLLQYVHMGVDGFRFDVASFLPLDFLQEAHAAVKALDADTIWLSESVHGHFLRLIRGKGFECLSESEVYQVFDMAYDYDTHPFFEAYLKGEGSLARYVESVMLQEEIYPKNYIKMRNLENHDFGRIASFVKQNPTKLKNWHAFSFFAKGSTMIYMGGEYSDSKHPDLFDKDVFSKDGENLSSLINKLSHITKMDVFTYGQFDLKVASEADVIVGSYENENTQVIGVFNISDSKGTITIKGLTGDYLNLITDETITFKDDTLTLSASPLLLKRHI